MKIYSNEVKNYATAIHALTCNASHIDQCGWQYGEHNRECDYREAEKKLEQLKKMNINPEILMELAVLLRGENVRDILIH